jgi:DNA-binding NtrC family response regulator
MNYPWPGNIRELEHALEHACVLCRETRIEVEHLPREIGEYAAPHPMPQEPDASDEADAVGEAAAIRRALQQTDGNKAKAARLLGMARQTLYRKIEHYGLTKSGD